MLLSCASMARSMIELCYRKKRRGRTADERDTHEGRMMELNGWISAVQELGDWICAEYEIRVALRTETEVGVARTSVPETEP